MVLFEELLWFDEELVFFEVGVFVLVDAPLSFFTGRGT